MREQLQHEERTREREMRRQITQLRARNAELDRERDRIIQEAHDAGVHTSTIPGRRSPAHTIVINPGEPLRILRSPEPMDRRRREHRGASSAGRSTLPTPPLDTSGPEEDTVNTSFVAETEYDEPSESQRLRRAQPLHPLRHSWQASESPEPAIDDLGDRNRSPTPGDGWEIMRTTIAPDQTLPSQDSSFASAAASFNVSNHNSQSTEQTSNSSTSRRDSSNDENENDSASSVDPDDMICTDEDIYSTEAFAEDMYFHEMQTPEGRERIAAHQRIRDRDGNRFALQTEPARVDIGFRLIEEALESDDGRERVLHIRQGSTENDGRAENTLRSVGARSARMLAESRRSGRALRQSDAAEAPTPRPDLYSTATHDAANETRRQVNGYFRRFAAGSMPVDGPIIESPASPPPEYEPLSSHPNVNTFTSRDGPQAHPISPPSNRSEREVSEALLSGDVQDLDSMRRVVERLAARDDVPEEWWMSMGLNVSRARVRDRSPARDPRSSEQVERRREISERRDRELALGRGDSRL